MIGKSNEKGKKSWKAAKKQNTPKVKHINHNIASGRYMFYI